MRLRTVLPSAAVAAGAFFLLSDPSSAEVIDGTPGDDTEHTGSDDDVINGNGGNDHFGGGPGNDTITTGDGHDYVHGDEGDDVISTGGGEDLVEGNEGDDEIDAGAGDDLVEGGEGDDTLNGGDGDDGVSGGAGDDTIDGGAGDDVLVGDGGVCYASAPDQLLEATAEAFAPCLSEEGFTTPGDDIIDGGDGDDVIVGDGGICDTGAVPELPPITPAAISSPDDPDSECDDGDDTLNGGDGNDLIIGDGSFPYSCLVIGPIGSDGVIAQGGSPFPDFLEACFDGGDDDIDGGAGNDFILGGGGDDGAVGGTGSDVVFGDSFTLDFTYAFTQLDFLAEEIERIMELLATPVDDLDEEDYEELLGFLEIIFLTGLYFPGGDDVVCGGTGDLTPPTGPGSMFGGSCDPDGLPDVLIGGNGNDIVCGDEADPLVLGGGGSDVPCPALEGEIDATSGTATGSLATGIRALNDEGLEVDENGDHNPYNFVILNATLVSQTGDLATYKTAKGTIVINVLTGEFTYTADAGAFGADNVEYALQRRIVDCPDWSEVQVRFLNEEPQTGLPGPCDDEVVGQAIIEVGGDAFIQSLSKILTFLLGEAPVDQPGVQPEVRTPRSTAPELARTGIDPLAMALTGLGLVALGTMAQQASRRRRLGFELR